MKKSITVGTPGRTRFAEQCWVLTGTQDEETGWRFRRRCKSTGAVASVEAAWAWALKREEQFGDVVGFFHTHPPGIGAQLSARDILTMSAWCSAFGKSLLCVIAAGKVVRGYIFRHANSPPEPVESVLKREQGWFLVRLKDA